MCKHGLKTVAPRVGTVVTRQYQLSEPPNLDEFDEVQACGSRTTKDLLVVTSQVEFVNECQNDFVASFSASAINQVGS